MSFLIPLVAAITPFIIWPIELLLPYPYIIEEIVKGFLVFFAIDCARRNIQVKVVLAAALLFTFSETVLYTLNIALVGDLSTLLTRFILTSILHSLTMFIMLISTFKHKWFLLIGVVVAMSIHYFYNTFI
ncbi:MAG: PrsW family glutamic-type intramembrane protease [Candidatus Daviesbacteria bacterium]|nr:PrsW family glutamic-type intramembrane protease [Candidatus Daviesbacteria bacterium]